MVTTCWAVKGGSGTTVVAAALALRRTIPSLLVDLDGDLPAALGIAPPDRPGVLDWLASDAGPATLDELIVTLGSGTGLLPARSVGLPSSTPTPAVTAVPDARWAALGQWLADWERRHDGEATIDAGTGEPPSALVDRADRSLLVTRLCYLALRRASHVSRRPTGIVVVEEPGRAYRGRTVEQILGAPVELTVPWHPSIARAVDSGLLEARLPRELERPLRDPIRNTIRGVVRGTERADAGAGVRGVA
jgi:hypothetical protein